MELGDRGGVRGAGAELGDRGGALLPAVGPEPPVRVRASQAVNNVAAGEALGR